MRLALLLWVAAASLVAAPAAAKEFRYWYGMQWVIEPSADGPSTVSVKQGGIVTEARMLTEDLFETRSQIIVAGKVILDRDAQLATALSAQSIRCTVARGTKGTLSGTRRICLTDADRDGKFDHYFDVGLGQGGFDVQFTGCIPNDATAIAPIEMEAVDPGTLRDPMKFRVQLKRIGGKKVTAADGSVTFIGPTDYEFGGSIGRNDRIWNFYSFCSSYGCRVPIGTTMGVEKEGVVLRVLRQEGDAAVISILHNLNKRNYWDMSRGNRPDPLYCPGTLFVKTDQHLF